MRQHTEVQRLPPGERERGATSRQDGEQFEECLRRCHALEQRLTQQVTREKNSANSKKNTVENTV